MAPGTGVTMDSFPQGFQLLVIGASGAIGGAFVASLRAMPECALAQGAHRQSTPPVDFDDAGSVARASAAEGQSSSSQISLRRMNHGIQGGSYLADTGSPCHCNPDWPSADFSFCRFSS